MSYTWKGEQHFESTKTTSKALARRILDRREGEIAMDLFKLGRQGGRMSFTGLCTEFESAHVPTLAASTQSNVRKFLASMKKFFGDRSLEDIDAKLVADYRNHRKAQPSRKDPSSNVKGATVNREMAYLRCMFNFAIERKYIVENPARGVKTFDERRERPAKRMLSLEEEQRILRNAPPYLRVAIVLTNRRSHLHRRPLPALGAGRSRSPCDFFFSGKTKTEGSSEPVPLTGLARDVLHRWKQEQGSTSPFLFPSPVKPDQPVTTLRRPGRPRCGRQE